METIAKRDYVSAAVIRRLPRYYRFLGTLLSRGVTRISSREIAQMMGLTASQIRQDLNCFGGFGQQGYGYNVEALRSEIGRILGLDKGFNAILVGAGNLGRAIANYVDFSAKGFNLIGIFDKDPAKVGTLLAGHTIQSTDDIAQFCREHMPDVAALTIPLDATKAALDTLVGAGVLGFWNFTHYDVAYDYPQCSVESVFLEDSLMTLSYLINEKHNDEDDEG